MCCRTDKDERGLSGPDSYENFNALSKICQDKYLNLIRYQIIFLSIIALLSTLPELDDPFEKYKIVSQICMIIIVLLSMIIQFKENYMEGWQKSRFIAESVLTECWQMFFRINQYDKLDYNESLKILLSRIKKIKDEINVKGYLSICAFQNNDNDNPLWIKDNYNKDIGFRKNFYIENRINTEITWYSSRGKFNKCHSSLFFMLGLGSMFFGMVLMILILTKTIPNLAYLGFFTTISASIFSWKQTKRFEELKTTYSVASDELSDFRKLIITTTDENGLKELIIDAERAISREHKLWFNRMKD